MFLETAFWYLIFTSEATSLTQEVSRKWSSTSIIIFIKTCPVPSAGLIMTDHQQQCSGAQLGADVSSPSPPELRWAGRSVSALLLYHFTVCIFLRTFLHLAWECRNAILIICCDCLQVEVKWPGAAPLKMSLSETCTNLSLPALVGPEQVCRCNNSCIM